MTVVDTNAVAYLVIQGQFTRQTESARSRDPDWRVPGLFVHEWLNVVTRHVEERFLGRDEAIRAYRRGLALVKIDARPPDPVRVLNLHASSGCTSYDLQFVALADDLRVKLLTADNEVLKAFPDLAVDLKLI